MVYALHSSAAKLGKLEQKRSSGDETSLQVMIRFSRAESNHIIIGFTSSMFAFKICDVRILAVVKLSHIYCSCVTFENQEIPPS